MNEKRIKRTGLTDKDIEFCHKLVDDLVLLYRETDVSLGKKSEPGKDIKSQQALNKVGQIASILTEWAEHHVFGIYYNMAKSENNWMEPDQCDLHKYEAMWFTNDPPEDLFSNDDHLKCERAAIADILQNTFGRYGRMGWRLSLREALYALNEGQVDWLLRPIVSGKQGNAYDLERLKWCAVKYIYRLKGQGWKKTAAYQEVAEKCGVSFETIKKWEKEGIRELDPTKENLMSIEAATKLIQDFPEDFDDDGKIYITAIQLNNFFDPSDPKSKAPNWLSSGLILTTKLVNDYPIEELKERLLRAGLRS